LSITLRGLIGYIYVYIFKGLHTCRRPRDQKGLYREYNQHMILSSFGVAALLFHFVLSVVCVRSFFFFLGGGGPCWHLAGPRRQEEYYLDETDPSARSRGHGESQSLEMFFQRNVISTVLGPRGWPRPMGLGPVARSGGLGLALFPL